METENGRGGFGKGLSHVNACNNHILKFESADSVRVNAQWSGSVIVDEKFDALPLNKIRWLLLKTCKCF